MLNAVHFNADEVRSCINKDLGFSVEDRIEQARRMGWLCDQVVKAGGFAIADFICPTPDTRAAFGDAVVTNPSLRAAIWGEGADPDADGYPNVAEAYFGMTPTTPDSPHESSVRIDGTALVYRWRTSDVAGIDAVPQWSDDLHRWHLSGERVGGAARIIEMIEDGDFREARLPLNGLTRAALRLIVARSQPGA